MVSRVGFEVVRYAPAPRGPTAKSAADDRQRHGCREYSDQSHRHFYWDPGDTRRFDSFTHCRAPIRCSALEQRQSSAETQGGSALPQSTRTSISPCPARSGGTLAPTLFASSELLRHGLDSFDSICWGPMRAFFFAREMEFDFDEVRIGRSDELTPVRM